MDTHTTEQKILFTLPDHGKKDVPIKELHFYKWMLTNKVKNPHRIDTLRAYLKDIGFDRERCTLAGDWEDNRSILNACIEMYFQWEIKPTIVCKFCGTDKDLGNAYPMAVIVVAHTLADSKHQDSRTGGRGCKITWDYSNYN